MYTIVLWFRALIEVNLLVCRRLYAMKRRMNEYLNIFERSLSFKTKNAN